MISPFHRVRSRLLPGILAVLFYLVALPGILSRSDRVLGLPIGLRRFYDKLGFYRYSVFVMLLLGMIALPIKMILRWTINLKYIVAMPEIFFNI